MDLGSVTSATTQEALASAWTELVEGEVDAATELGVAITGLVQTTPGEALLQTLTQPGLGEGTFDEPHAGLATTPTRTPGPQADHSLESASVQTFARPHAPVTEPLRPTDTALPSAAHARSEFALPADQLIPVTLIGLQVEPAGSWPLLRRDVDAALPELPRTAKPSEQPIHDEADDQHDEATPEPEQHDEPADAAGLVFDEPDAGDWCEPLTVALREALAAKIPPQALLAAAEQWRRGRCVVLACPQGADPAGPAWAFVLWPRARSGAGVRPESRRDAASGAASLALFGLRVEARLQWSARPRPAQWCHVRVVKEHHPRRGRQLIALDHVGATQAAASAAVPCEVQLGPVLARSLHWCEVCVRINAVRRFWAALGGQWSVNVVVCSLPLVGTRAPDLMEA